MTKYDIVPECYKCPITYCLMKNPVILPLDSQTYERSEIIKCKKSPITHQEFDPKTLIVNYALKNAIEEFKKTHNIDPDDLFEENDDIQEFNLIHHENVRINNNIVEYVLNSPDDENKLYDLLRLNLDNDEPNPFYNSNFNRYNNNNYNEGDTIWLLSPYSQLVAYIIKVEADAAFVNIPSNYGTTTCFVKNFNFAIKRKSRIILNY
jgi:hypothetical protein